MTSGIVQTNYYRPVLKQNGVIVDEINIYRTSSSTGKLRVLSTETTSTSVIPQLQVKAPSSSYTYIGLIQPGPNYQTVSGSGWSTTEFEKIFNPYTLNPTSEHEDTFGYTNSSPWTTLQHSVTFTLSLASRTVYTATSELEFVVNGTTVKTYSLVDEFEASPTSIVMNASVFPEITIPPGTRFDGWDMYNGVTHVTVSGESNVDVPAGEDITFTAILTSLANIHIYNGEEWLDGKAYIYNGEEWLEGEPYIYDGTEWRKGI